MRSGFLYSCCCSSQQTDKDVHVCNWTYVAMEKGETDCSVNLCHKIYCLFLIHYPFTSLFFLDDPKPFLSSVIFM